MQSRKLIGTEPGKEARPILFHIHTCTEYLLSNNVLVLSHAPRRADAAREE